MPGEHLAQGFHRLIAPILRGFECSDFALNEPGDFVLYALYFGGEF
jgi:hypothetical protein